MNHEHQFNYIDKQIDAIDPNINVKIVMKIVMEKFKYLPDAFKTQTLCDAAFMYNIDNFQYIPDLLKTRKMIDELFTVVLEQFIEINDTHTPFNEMAHIMATNVKGVCVLLEN